MDGAFQRDTARVNTIIVSRMVPDEAALLHELRLEALTAHPAFLGADADYEAGITQERRRESLAAHFWMLARVDGAVAGFCVFNYPAHNKKQKHTGHLGSMYVRDAFRGMGVADALLKAVFDQAITCVEQIALSVTAENARAIKFYERFGFRPYGRIPRSIRVGDRDYDELEMMRSVSASD